MAREASGMVERRPPLNFSAGFGTAVPTGCAKLRRKKTRLMRKRIMHLRPGLRVKLLSGYLTALLLMAAIGYVWLDERRDYRAREDEYARINRSREEALVLYARLVSLSLLGETATEWEQEDAEEYRRQRMDIERSLDGLGNIVSRSETDSVRGLLECKEERLLSIMRLSGERDKVAVRITRHVPAPAKIAEEPPKKKKRGGFLGLFGKKEKQQSPPEQSQERDPRHGMIAVHQEQNRRLSELSDSLALDNRRLNRRLQGIVARIERKVQADIKKADARMATSRERSLLQTGCLTGVLVLLLILSYTVIRRDAARIWKYRHKTLELIGKLKRTVRQNEELIASRKKAMHTVTHELRTPLTAITGYAGLMAKEGDIDKTAAYLRNIRQSAGRMRDMLDTLLGFFRLDNGKEQANLSPCRISAITHILETEFMPAAMDKGLSFTVTARADAVVLADKEHILQIGNNLLSNAIKFTENGGISLTTDYDGGMLKLIVEDTGTGMTDEEQQRVFGAFERLSNAAAKDGFGLGLSIVQRIVAMLGGTVLLESERGKGSRFTVEIPAQRAEELPEHVNRKQLHEHAFRDVIAIDNDEVLLLMLKEMYAQEGIHCDTCTDTAELMERIRGKEYSLLLTDLHMPEIDGFGLLELLRSSNVGNSRVIPVVAATASGSCSEAELIGSGFAGCLFKPFSISELMEVSDRCALKCTNGNNPDFSALLSYGNEAVMLEKLITETEKEMRAVRDAELREDLQTLDALTHHLRSSWEILRTDRPLRELYRMLHGESSPDGEAIRSAVNAVLDMGAEIIRLAKEERNKYENG